MTQTLSIEYPDTLPARLHQTKEEFEREAKLAMAVKLFESKRISSGMAASLAGMDRAAFLLQLHKHNAAMIDFEDAAIDSDFENA